LSSTSLRHLPCTIPLLSSDITKHEEPLEAGLECPTDNQISKLQEMVVEFEDSRLQEVLQLDKADHRSRRTEQSHPKVRICGTNPSNLSSLREQKVVRLHSIWSKNFSCSGWGSNPRHSHSLSGHTSARTSIRTTRYHCATGAYI
jgi:hypothetical protein